MYCMYIEMPVYIVRKKVKRNTNFFKTWRIRMDFCLDEMEENIFTLSNSVKLLKG